MSDADMLTDITPLSVVLFDGDVIDTTGAVVSVAGEVSIAASRLLNALIRPYPKYSSYPNVPRSSAFCVKISYTCVLVSEGLIDQMRAASPAVNGDANDVPLQYPYPPPSFVV